MVPNALIFNRKRHERRRACQNDRGIKTNRSSTACTRKIRGRYIDPINATPAPEQTRTSTRAKAHKDKSNAIAAMLIGLTNKADASGRTTKASGDGLCRKECPASPDTNAALRAAVAPSSRHRRVRTTYTQV
jgi:hypothetical protein